MTLTKAEIEYIDDYLKKNEVNYWDVRMELLDHIVSDVETQINTDGLSFNEALFNVHRKFGNAVYQSRLPKSKLLSKGIYQNNIGFKKFIAKEQKTIAKNHRTVYFKTLKNLFLSPKFIIEYLLFLAAIYAVYNYYSAKAAIILTAIAVLLPELIKLNYAFREGIRRSLVGNLVGGLHAASLSMLGGLAPVLDMINPDLAIYKKEIFIIVLCIFYPSCRANLMMYMSVIKTQLKNYKLLLTNG